jgi:chemotaxis protein MotB
MAIRKSMMILVAGVLAGVVGAGCGISKSEHQSVVDERDACQKERDAHAAERSELAKKLEETEGKLKAELEASGEELEELRKQRAEADRQLAEFQKLTEKFQEMIVAEGIEVYTRRGKMIVALPSSVLFPSGKAELSKRGLATLNKVAGKLKDFDDRRFIVAGHTDNVPIGQVDFEDNWHLSTARALRVVRFLIEQGLNPQNLAATGYGEYDPVQSNKSKAGRTKNRRIELILEPVIPDFTKLSKLNKEAAKKTGEAKKSAPDKKSAPNKKKKK